VEYERQMNHFSIASKIASISEVEKQKNRRNLKLIIDATMFLAKQSRFGAILRTTTAKMPVIFWNS
jgi:hypothetical protein